MDYVETRVKGKTFRMPSVRIAGRAVMKRGRWIKMAAVRDEELVEGTIVENPESFISQLKYSGLRADILTFSQPFDEQVPRHPYFFEWDNVAVASTDSFTGWWEKLPQETRKNVRRASKRGVSVRVVQFDDKFVQSIKDIYDESPVRQGTRFWHYGKNLATVKMENETYLERSEFIGAYHNHELIGFIRFVYVDRAAIIMQILSKISHYDKRPMNALIAKAVEVCSEKRISQLVYSKMVFGNKKTSQLTEFKRRNGFEKMCFPRYYVPLTTKGRIALALGLHRGALGVLPFWLINLLLSLRSAGLNLLANSIARRKAQISLERVENSIGR
jgi:hypothetical protein